MVAYPPIHSFTKLGGNPLFTIDFEANEIEQFASHPSSNQWNAFLAMHRGGVLALRSRGYEQKSFIMSYDLQTGGSTLMLEAVMDTVGSEYHAIDSCDDMIYAVYSAKPSAELDKSVVIRVYDGDFDNFKDVALDELADVADAMAFYIMDFRAFCI
ncbi:MAG: hypothetical protein LBH09_05900 [Peptococcaceae bacterium]|jgi:hypothetical protein|nr:hypothetical protein [Peptococcaceae bacterium]